MSKQAKSLSNSLKPTAENKSAFLLTAIFCSRDPWHWPSGVRRLLIQRETFKDTPVGGGSKQLNRGPGPCPLRTRSLWIKHCSPAPPAHTPHRSKMRWKTFWGNDVDGLVRVSPLIRFGEHKVKLFSWKDKRNNIAGDRGCYWQKKIFCSCIFFTLMYTIERQFWSLL